MDKRNCIKFCVKDEIKRARVFEMYTVALDESTRSRTQVQLWYNWFKAGQEDFNEDAHHSVKCKGFAYGFLQSQWRGAS